MERNKMNYQEFLDKIKKAEIDTKPYVPFDIDNLFIYSDETGKKGKKEQKPFIFQYWISGGKRGGGLNTKPDHAVNGEIAPSSFEDFDKILELIDPNISFLKYKTLYTKVVKEDQETYYEYYGNCSIYSYRLVLLEDLYKALFS